MHRPAVEFHGSSKPRVGKSRTLRRARQPDGCAGALFHGETEEVLFFLKGPRPRPFKGVCCHHSEHVRDHRAVSESVCKGEGEGEGAVEVGNLGPIHRHGAMS